MATIVTRAGKGSPLTAAEGDANFTNLNTDKAEVGSANTFTAAQRLASGASFGANDVYVYESATNTLAIRTGASGAYKYTTFGADGTLKVNSGTLQVGDSSGTYARMDYRGFLSLGAGAYNEVFTTANLTGNRVSAARTDTATDVTTCKEMRWKNYGNGHTIIDASAGTAPDGSAINSSNPGNSWSATYPTLMGWNGSATYGVRVDVARYSESTNPLINRVQTNGITYGGLGSISVTGSTGGWCGVVLNDAGGLLMDNGATHGYYRNNNAWLWQCDNSGNFTATGNVTAYSDERLKKNWRDVSDDFIEQWALIKHGVYDRTDKELTQVGVSAQAVQRIVPEAIVENVDGYLTLNYGGINAIATVKLAARVVEQDTIIRELSLRIAALEAK